MTPPCMYIIIALLYTKHKKIAKKIDKSLLAPVKVLFHIANSIKLYYIEIHLYSI